MRTVAVVAFAAFLACAPHQVPQLPASPAPARAERVELRMGERAGHHGLAVRLVRVEGDSRCPAGVPCISAGDAVVVVDLRAAGRSATAELHVNPTRGPQEAELGGRKVRLLLLRPGSASPDEAYVAVFAVSP